MTADAENPACATGKIRLFVASPLQVDAELALTREQSHYLVNVMRQTEGGRVLLFNGRNGEWQAEVVKARKKACVLKINTQTRAQDYPPDLELWFAPVKRAATDSIAQKATELGVAAIRPVMTRRTNTARVRDDRLKSTVIEAAEQCGRLTVPDILEADDLSGALAGLGDKHLMFCDESGMAPPAREALAQQDTGAWVVLIGPEGGFDAEERAMLAAQDRVVGVSLGPRIMRADTAAIAALTLWQSTLGDW